jgi:hypothetical protein
MNKELTMATTKSQDPRPLLPEQLGQEDDEPTGGAAPLDADWADRENAARHDHAAPASPAEPAPADDSDAVQDEGVLESLGKAVSAPVRDADEPDAPGS